MENEALDTTTAAKPRTTRARKSTSLHSRRSNNLFAHPTLLTTFLLVVTLGLGLGLLTWGGIVVTNNLKLLSMGKRAEGTITRVQYVQNEVIRTYKDFDGKERTRREKVNSPVSTVSFRAEDEQLYELKAGSVAEDNVLEHKVGNKVGIIYDPANPNNASIDNAWAQWQPSLVLLGIGLASLFVSILLFRNLRHMRPSGRVDARDIRVSKLGKALDTLWVLAWNIVAIGAAVLWLTQSHLSQTWYNVICIAPALLGGLLLLVGVVWTFRPRTT